MLGRGGMGEVWKAYDTAMNRVVALKVLPPNLADDAQYQARFRREAQAAASLDEPHIVPIHDFGEIDGRLYVTMRLIDGKTIDALVADGPLSPQRAVSIVEQIAAAPLREGPRIREAVPPRSTRRRAPGRSARRADP